MADSNEITENQQAHPRLRTPQAGVKAQKGYDAGEPLTTGTMVDRMNDVMLDLMNDRIDRNKALTIAAVGNVIVKVAALELKHRELYWSHQYKHEKNLEEPEPLRLAAGSGKKK